MTFEEVLQQASGMLQRLGRASYQSLKRQFDLDDDYFAALKEGLLYTHSESIEDDGCGFRWTGEPSAPTQHPQPETDFEIQFLPSLSGNLWD